MKLPLLFFIYLSFIYSSFSQNQKVGGYKVNGFDFSESKDEKSLKSNYYKKLKTLIFENLDKQDLKFIDENLSKKDSTYNIRFTYWINKKGAVIDNLIGSTLRQKNPAIHEKTKTLLKCWIIDKKQCKLAKTLLDKQHFINLTIKKNSSNDYKIYNRKKKNKPSIAYESITSPVYEGCKIFTKNSPEKSFKAQRKCMEQKLQNFVVGNVDINFINIISQVLSKGYKIYNKRITTYTQFKFNKKGEVSNIKVLSLLPEIENEIYGIIKKVPKAQPGTKEGIPVGVLYSLPVIFKTSKS